MPTSFEVIFLGTLPLIDTVQGDEDMENAAALLGTYGTSSAPLSSQIRNLTADRLSEDDNNSYDVDNGGGFDSFRINGGSPQNFDGVATYNAVITYADGTTATITATIFQDVFGNTYLAPEETNNSDQIALTAAPIQSITLKSVLFNTGDMIANRVAGDFKSAVDGTAGNDNMTLGSGYTDAQGEQITTGNDYIIGGAGNDTINADAGNDTVLGGDGNDVIDDWGGNDLVYAGAGNDRVDLSIGNDTIFMDDGDDTIRVWDNAGNNSLNGGTGNDLLDFTNFQSSSGATVNVGPDGSGNFSHFSGATTGTFTGFETISGTGFDDRMVATTNTTGIGMAGEAGNDLLIGGSGQDQLDGGAGTDTIYGNGGADSITGGDGNDRIYGDNTDPEPVIVNNGNFATNTNEGWATSGGGNTFVYSQAMAFNANNTGFGGVAQQTVATQVGLSYQLSLNAFELGTGSGNHTLVVEVVDSSGQVIASQTVVVNNGTSQTINLNFTALTPNVTLRFTNPTSTATNETDLMIDNVTVTTLTPLAEGNDTINAGDGDDFVDAGGGNDSVTGGVGNDVVFSDLGNDTVDGGAGNDTIYGGGGADSITGGDGADRIFGDNATPAPVTVTNGTFATGTTAGWAVTGAGTFVDGQALAFNAGNNGFGGTAQQTVATEIGFEYQLSFNTFENGSGSANHTLVVEVIDANGQVIGAQTITVANGSNQVITVDFTATTASTTLRFSNPTSTATSSTDVLIDNVTVTPAAVPATTGNDTINAGEGSDFVDAGSGDDTVIVDGTFAGDDTLDGGAGTDTLVLTPADNRNLTVDMVAGNVADGQSGSQQFSNFENVTTGGGNDSVIGNSGANLISAMAGNDTVRAGDGNDTIQGGDGNDSLLGEAGNDVLSGNSGNDFLFGGDGSDVLSGDDGNDNINAGDGNDSIFGGIGNDTIEDGNGNDIVYAGAGNDVATIGTGNDTLYLDDGNDTVNVADNTGTNSLFGGTGTDVLNFTNVQSASGATVTFNGNGAGTFSHFGGATTGTFSEFEGVSGTANADTLNASATTSGVTLDGEAGNDTLTGGSGNDSLIGGAGDDSILAGMGNDTVFYGPGQDTVFGGGGDDLIDDAVGFNSTTGPALVYGGDGNDTVWGTSGADSLYGDAGNDQLGGDGGDDALFGGTGNDTLNGSDGNDVLTGGMGNDRLDGGAGSDRAIFTGPVTDYSFDYGPGGELIVTDTVANRDGTDTLTGVEFATFNGVTYRVISGDDGSNTTLQGPNDGTPSLIIAHDGNDWGGGHSTSDVVFGGAGDDTLDGGDGNDTLVGEGDNDLLRGDGGDDSLIGGTGSDTLQGGSGNDVLEGGDGNDSLQGDDGSDTLIGGAGQDTLNSGRGNDQVFGGDGDDVFTVSDDHGRDTLDGGSGYDQTVFATPTSSQGVTVVYTGNGVGGYEFDGTASGGEFTGIEQFSGTSNADTFDASASTDGTTIYAIEGDDSLIGGSGNDRLYGGTGNDSLVGGAGNDTLDGGTGNDTLTGGSGNDTLTTGDGADVLILTASGGGDRITDFDMTRVNGRTVDQIDVSDLTNANGDPIGWRDVTVTDTVGDGSGDAVLTFANGESIILEGVTVAEAQGRSNLIAIGIPCFVTGTPIRTPQGWTCVEHLVAGDLVVTTEGLQRVRWAGRRDLSPEDLARDPERRPIHFPVGSIGNTEPLRLSPQHAVLMRGRDGQRLLVRAKHLAEIGFGGARAAHGARAVSYHHILLDRHAVVCAAGAATESFYPGPLAIEMLDWSSRLALMAAIGVPVGVGTGSGGFPEPEAVARHYGPRLHPLARRKALAGLSVLPFAEPALQGQRANCA
jgi:Ca2+-binding RTX toxin-like protein